MKVPNAAAPYGAFFSYVYVVAFLCVVCGGAPPVVVHPQDYAPPLIIIVHVVRFLPPAPLPPPTVQPPTLRLLVLFPLIFVWQQLLAFLAC